MSEQHVSTAAELDDLVDALRSSAWLALDTEFIREKTFYARLCLIQVSNGDIHATVDPLAIDDLASLKSLLLDGDAVKVFHAARQDLEIFLHDWGRIPTPLFDTQPAAALLGLGDQVGYARLVKQVLDVELPKDQSRTDWSRRPLAADQLRYALDDVIYLGQLYRRIYDQLADRDRLGWLTADFAALADPDTYVLAPQSAWTRVKGRQRLRGVELAVLRSLAAWREHQATSRDLPRKWILKDEDMLELAKRRPTRREQLERQRGLDAGQLRRYGDALLAAIAEGTATPKADWPDAQRRPSPLTPTREAQIDLLMAALRLVAAEHQLSPAAIATRKDVETLVRGDAETPLLSGWRRQLAGDTLQRVMRGELALRSDPDGVALVATGTAPA